MPCANQATVIGLVATTVLTVLLSLPSSSTADSRAEQSTKPFALFVCVTDTSSGVPIVNAQVRIAKPVYPARSPFGLRMDDRGSGWPVWVQSLKPAILDEWLIRTDSSGCALLMGMAPGRYSVRVCSELHGHASGDVRTFITGRDTLRFELPFLGRPSHGRRCEVFSELKDAGEKSVDSDRKPEPTP